MEMRGTKDVEAMYNMHDLRLNNVPTNLVEGSGEAIGPRGFFTSGTKNSTFNLLREFTGDTVKVAIRDIELGSLIWRNRKFLGEATV
jgi:hypothetical protein